MWSECAVYRTERRNRRLEPQLHPAKLTETSADDKEMTGKFIFALVKIIIIIMIIKKNSDVSFFGENSQLGVSIRVKLIPVKSENHVKLIKLC